MEKEKKEDQQEKATDIVARDEIKLNTNSLLLFIIVILVIMSGIQVFQMQSISKAITNGSIKASSQIQGNTIGLPSQVGGCG